MSIEKIVATIEAKGIEGMKKTDIKRDFQEVEQLDSILQELVKTHEIFIDKKGNSFYCWHKNHYLQKLLSSDQKFSLLYTLMSSVHDSVNTKFDSLNSSLDTVTNQVRGITEEIEVLASSGRRGFGPDNPISQEQDKPTKINYDKFKEQLDQALTRTSTSIGWIELCNLRRDLCSRMNISREQFYVSFEEVISNNYDKYELSTGGEEGIQLRGMVHGFVRCI
jgi:DNA anti-recombination protein RmuC